MQQLNIKENEKKDKADDFHSVMKKLSVIMGGNIHFKE
jgi:hypothetical protein